MKKVGILSLTLYLSLIKVDAQEIVHQAFLEPREGIRVPALPSFNKLCRKYVINVHSLQDPNSVFITHEIAQFHIKRNQSTTEQLIKDLSHLPTIIEKVEEINACVLAQESFTVNATLSTDEQEQSLAIALPEKKSRCIKLTFTPAAYIIFNQTLQQ